MGLRRTPPSLFYEHQPSLLEHCGVSGTGRGEACIVMACSEVSDVTTFGKDWTCAIQTDVLRTAY